MTRSGRSYQRTSSPVRRSLHTSLTPAPLSPRRAEWHRTPMPALRIPLRWTSLLLLASIALTTIGVVEASRAVRSQRVVAEHALRDYAGFAAWSYQQHLRQRLSAATEEL